MEITATLESPEMPAKRAYGSGTVRQRGDTWEIGYRPEPGGKQIYERVGRASEGISRADAEHALMERLVTIGRGGGAQFLGHPFHRVARQWLDQVVALQDPEQRTLELYINAIEVHLIPAFGDDYLHTIDVSLLERYISKKLSIAPTEPGAVPVKGKAASARTEPLGIRSIEQQLSVLNQIFNWAVRENKMTTNPVPLVELKRQRRSNLDKKKPLEQEEVNALLEHAVDEERELIFLLLASLGLRLGELFALHISDYNPRRKTLTIQRTLTRNGGRTVIKDFPKTRAGLRELRLSPYLAMRVERQIARAELACAQEKKKLLFPNKRGRVRAESNFRNREWAQSLEAARLPDYVPHQLRHTFVSETLASRPDLPITQLTYLLGHASAAVTYSVYSHILKRHKSEIADISDLYSPAASAASSSARSSSSSSSSSPGRNDQ